MDRMIRSDRLKQISKFPKTLGECHERIDILEKDRTDLLQLLSEAKSELARVIAYRIKVSETQSLPNPLELSIESTLSNLNCNSPPKSGSSISTCGTKRPSIEIQGTSSSYILEQFDTKYIKGNVLTSLPDQDFSKSNFTETSTIFCNGLLNEFEK